MSASPTPPAPPAPPASAGSPASRGPGAGRLALIAFALVAVAGAIALVLAGASDERRTAFSTQVPAAGLVAVLAPGREMCQGQVPVTARFSGLELWADPVRRPGSRLRVRVLGAGGAPLATGVLPTPYAIHYNGSRPDPDENTPSTFLSRAVPAGETVTVCLRNLGAMNVLLYGASPRSSGALELYHRSLGAAAALVMLRPRPVTLLSSLPAVFARAALFRPAWMGAWTYWLLFAGLVLAFPLGGAALWLAVRAEAEPDPGDADRASAARAGAQDPPEPA